MPRLTLIALIALVFAITGCSVLGRGSDPTVAEQAAVPTTTTVVQTTSAPETTTSTAPTTTTSTLPTTTTTELVEAPAAAPTNALDSFQWEFVTSIGAGDTSLLTLSSSGTYADGDIECRIVTGFSSFDFETGAILVDGTAHLDAGDGEGYQEVPVDDPAFQESLGLCAGSERFWADMTGGEDVPSGGQIEERNGVETRRLDLSGLTDQAGALGLVAPGIEGVAFDELTFWVATEGDWISSIVMNATLDAETLAAVTGSEVSDPGHIDITLDVTSPNDPGLSVVAP